MKNKLTVISDPNFAPLRWARQWSVKKSFFYGQKGIGMLLLIGIISLIILGVVAASTPQIRNLISSSKNLSTPSPAPSPVYTEKQKLYLRNKETIQKSLNLNEEQFNLLVQSAGKN